MKTANVSALVLEEILHKNLRMAVVFGNLYEEGERVEFIETENDVLTGRSFFVKVLHVLSYGAMQAIQFTVEPIMNIKHEDGTVERFTMTGEFESEKFSIAPEPTHEEGKLIQEIACEGDKAIWLYKGEKWVEEICLTGATFYDSQCQDLLQMKPTPPALVKITVKGKGGDTEYLYENVV